MIDEKGGRLRFQDVKLDSPRSTEVLVRVVACAWAVLHDQFEEGGFTQSGEGRKPGLAVFDDFLEYKHIALSPGLVEAGTVRA